MSDNSDTNNPTALSLMIILSILGGFSFETEVAFNCFDVSWYFFFVIYVWLWQDIAQAMCFGTIIFYLLNLCLTVSAGRYSGPLS